MNVTICWGGGYSGYMAAFFGALMEQREEFKFSFFALQTALPYSRDLLKGLPVKIFQRTDGYYPLESIDEIVATEPDILVVSNLAARQVRRLIADPRLKKTKILLYGDTAWHGAWKQFLHRFVFTRARRRLAGMIVAGERGRQYARYVGFRQSQIFYSAFGCDYHGFSQSYTAKTGSGKSWPHNFVFIGRYAPEKGLDVLLEAYQRYRELCPEPWELHCYGTGPLADMLKGQSGIIDHGFTQPEQLAGAMAQHGVFILPSNYEPWGIVVAEAASAGLPLICSDACCAAIDLLRHLYNGLIFASGDVEQLLRCLVWMHENSEKLPEMGNRAHSLAEAYSPEIWAQRWIWAFRTVCQKQNALSKG